MRDFLKDVESGEATSPEAAAQAHMRPKLIKRFYKEVSVSSVGDAHTVLLDGKSIKTPGRNEIAFASKSAAQLFADEWDAQEAEINPMLMPITRIANTAIDGIAQDPQAVLEDIVRFASSDLLYYRVNDPQELVELQREHWDPILDWIAQITGAHFEVGEGVMHVEQPKEALKLFSARLSQHSQPMQLCCLHTFTTLCGSALIALALAEDFLTPQAAWNAAHVDENFNISRWGEDYEAQKRAEKRFTELEAAFHLFRAL